MINVQVAKNPNENSGSVMRRFTKRVQGSGILRRARGLRYFTRSKSRNFQKMAKIESLKRGENYREQAKLGLLKPSKKKGRR